MAENSGDVYPIKEELVRRFPDYSIVANPRDLWRGLDPFTEGKISQAIKVITPNEETGISDEELEVFERDDPTGMNRKNYSKA